MKVFNVSYSMGGIVSGGYFNSVVVAVQKDDVKRLLAEEHMEDTSKYKAVYI